MTRYDPRFASTKRLHHMAQREKAPPAPPPERHWYDVLRDEWIGGPTSKLSVGQREAMVASLTRSGTQAIPRRFRLMRAQQLVDLLASGRSVWRYANGLPKKLAKGARARILAAKAAEEALFASMADDED